MKRGGGGEWGGRGGEGVHVLNAEVGIGLPVPARIRFGSRGPSCALSVSPLSQVSACCPGHLLWDRLY